MNIPPPSYTGIHEAALNDAIARRDTDAIVAIIGGIAADGYPELADRLTDTLIGHGLDSIAGQVTR